MTNIVKAALVAGAIAAAGLGFAGHASADNSDSIVGTKGDHDAAAYAAQLKVDGLKDPTTASSQQMGQGICAKRASGTSELELINKLVQAQTPPILAVDTVTAAEFHFCPDQGMNYSKSGTTTFLAAMHARQPGTTQITGISVPGADQELVALGKVACSAVAQNMIGHDLSAQLRKVEPDITFWRKDPMLAVDDPAIFLSNAATSYICPS
jgi:hypothetical protein